MDTGCDGTVAASPAMVPAAGARQSRLTYLISWVRRRKRAFELLPITGEKGRRKLLALVLRRKRMWALWPDCFEIVERSHFRSREKNRESVVSMASMRAGKRGDSVIER